MSDFCDRDGCEGMVIAGVCNSCSVPNKYNRMIKVSGLMISVEEVTLGTNHLGECSLERSRILIDKDIAEDLKEDTLIHEVIHMISAANALGLQETDVAVLAVNLSQYLRDN